MRKRSPLLDRRRVPYDLARPNQRRLINLAIFTHIFILDRDHVDCEPAELYRILIDLTRRLSRAEKDQEAGRNGSQNESGPISRGRSSHVGQMAGRSVRLSNPIPPTCEFSKELWKQLDGNWYRESSAVRPPQHPVQAHGLERPPILLDLPRSVRALSDWLAPICTSAPRVMSEGEMRAFVDQMPRDSLPRVFFVRTISGETIEQHRSFDSARTHATWRKQAVRIYDWCERLIAESR